MESYDFLNTVIKENNLGIKKITSISTLCQVFNTCSFGKTVLNQVHKLLQIYLTIPMTTATAERTFSTLRRFKNYLRTTMTQKRLNHVVLLHTHKQRTDVIDLDDVMRQFIGVNTHRLEYFGTF